LAVQVDWLFDAHPAAHWSSHCAWQKPSHAPGLRAVMQSVAQFPLHCDLHVLLQLAIAFALQSAKQCDPHPVTHCSVAPLSHPASTSPPMFAWQAEAVSMFAHASGHCNLACITQFSFMSMPSVRPHATTQAGRTTIATHMNCLAFERPTAFIRATIHPVKGAGGGDAIPTRTPRAAGWFHAFIPSLMHQLRTLE
jgi:hypothetical protein